VRKDPKILFVFGAALLVSLLAGGALAQSVGGTNPPGDQEIINLKDLSPFGECGKLDCVLAKILDLLYYIAIPITSIMVLWGGFQILTAAGKPEQVKTGGKTVLYAAVGFAVVIISRYVVNLISDILGTG
jgi:hypothetical protein